MIRKAPTLEEVKNGWLLLTVTDMTNGRSAAGIAYRLALRSADGRWKEVACGEGDLNGRIVEGPPLQGATYRLELDVERYFALVGMVSYLPDATVTFRVPRVPAEHRVDICIAVSAQFCAFRAAPGRSGQDGRGGLG